MQQYLVFSADALSIDFHYKNTMTKTRASDTEVTAEIVTAGDGAATHGTGNVSVSTLQAMYIPYSGISEDGISSYRIQLEANGGNAVILQMKPESGNLVWESSSELSTSYGTTGTTSMHSIVNALHDDNIYVVADISCFLDSTVASRNSALALTNASNEVYSDSYGSWLDPYNTEVQTYLSELVQELCSLGFDEIMLSNYCLPIEGIMGDRSNGTSNDTTDPDSGDPTGDDPNSLDTGDDETSNDDTTVDPTTYYVSEENPETIASVLSTLAEKLSDITSTYRTVLSIRCDNTALRNNLGTQTGQDLSMLKEHFSRLYCNTDEEHLESDTAVLEDALGDESNSRFVPIMKQPSDDGNWVVR